MNPQKGLLAFLLVLAAATAMWLRGCLAQVEKEELNPAGYPRQAWEDRG